MPPVRAGRPVLFGIQAGFLPSLYAQLTCHFITGEATVGENDVEFGLHFGLREFTPVDSVFRGYSYCQSYSGRSYNPPAVPRYAAVAATALGAVPLAVIGVYLGSAATHEVVWVGSMWMLFLAFVCQVGTWSIFLLDLCQGEDIACSMGPGAWTSGISSVAWFVLSMEMKVNSPLYEPVRAEGTVAIEKESPFVSGARRMWQRIKGENAPSLSRTAMSKRKASRAAVKKAKERPRRGEVEMSSQYRPPEIV